MEEEKNREVKEKNNRRWKISYLRFADEEKKTGAEQAEQEKEETIRS